MADETSTGGGSELLQSPLHENHARLGAKFAEFGGWSMPLEYPTGVVKEHTAVREAVGIFERWDDEAETYFVRKKDGSEVRVPARGVRFGKVVDAPTPPATD